MIVYGNDFSKNTSIYWGQPYIFANHPTIVPNLRQKT